jgi:hypothetical protein
VKGEMPFTTVETPYHCPPAGGWEGFSAENKPEDLPVAFNTSTSFRVKSRDEIRLDR